MTLFAPEQRRFADTIAQLVYVNPFLPERIELEKQALGPDYQHDQQTVWSLIPGAATQRDNNIDLLVQRGESLTNAIRDKLRKGRTATASELQLYDDLVMHLLYYRAYNDWHDFIEPDRFVPRQARPSEWKRFRAACSDYLEINDLPLASRGDPAFLYALFNQVRRAFFNIYQCVIGQSLPSARLRATIWESLFTFDARRYRRCLTGAMDDITTLITGPSGTGKDLVASAIGRSRFIDFDEERARFAVDAEQSFVPLNLSAMSAGLIESELFGHTAGAFTGATADRQGWLESADRFSTVFLDEIGDLDLSIQVKLLRVLQNRQFQRVGETRTRQFKGRIVTATNRDLESRIAAGQFREDLYYRLCSDVIRTPSLAELLADSTEDLDGLVKFIVGRTIHDATEQAAMVDYVGCWIGQNMPPGYEWPGNVRELEQCVRNIIVHNHYHPRRVAGPAEGLQRAASEFAAAELPMADMQSRYCTIAYWKAGTFEAAANRLGIDRRTVRARMDESLLEELRQTTRPEGTE